MSGRALASAAIALFVAGCAGTDFTDGAFPLLSANRSGGAAVRPEVFKEPDVPRPVIGRVSPDPEPAEGMRDFLPLPAKLQTLSLDGVPVAKAARLVLGEMLGFAVQVDPAFQAAISLDTGSGVPSSALLRMFDEAVRAAGGHVQVTGRVAFVNQGPPSLSPRGEFGGGVSVYRFRNVSVSDVITALQPFATGGLLLSKDQGANSLVVSGSGPEVEGVLALARALDDGALRSTSFAVVPSRDPVMVAQRTADAFAMAGPSVAVRTVALASHKAVFIVAVSPEVLERARLVVKQLDAFAAASEPQRFVYPLQSAKASEVVALLQPTLPRDAGGGASSFMPTVPVGGGVSSIGMPVAAPSASSAPVPPMSSLSMGNVVQLPQPSPQAQPVAAPMIGGGGTMFGGGSPSQVAASSFSPVLVADNATNSLVARMVARDWIELLPTIQVIDRPPQQVLIEANIVEVVLNDRLRYGVQASVQAGALGATVSNAIDGSLGASFPGVGASVLTQRASLVLDALQSMTDMRIVSTPSVLAESGEAATLSVGDQVPILKATTESTEQGGRVTQQIDYRDTGTVLRVTPRVDARGQVRLDVNLQVSAAITNTVGGIDSPVFQQRAASSIIRARDGQTVIIGGLRRVTSERGRTGIPGLMDVGPFGALFGANRRESVETELMLMLTPRVVSGVEALADLNEGQLERIAAAYRAWGGAR